MADIEAKREMAEAAERLLDDPAFELATRSLRELWLGLLMNEAGNTLQQGELCSRLRALDVISGQLRTFVLDYQKALKESARRSRPGA